MKADIYIKIPLTTSKFYITCSWHSNKISNSGMWRKC